MEREDRQGFELVRPYTITIWNQIAVAAVLILLDNRLAVPVQLWPGFGTMHRKTRVRKPHLKYSTLISGPTCTRTLLTFQRRVIVERETLRMLII